MAPNPRVVVGSFICAKVCHVTSDAKCKHLFGSNWNTKMLQGSVLRAFQQHSAAGRRYWIVVANYELSMGHTKVKELAMQSIIAEPLVTLATTMAMTETTTQAFSSTQPLSFVAATAAAE
jgi:hypothetical protein